MRGSTQFLPGCRRSVVRGAGALGIMAGLLLAPAGLPAAAWHEFDGGRYRELAVPREERAGFSRLTPQSTGVLFTNTLSRANAAENQIRLNGSGVALGDVNGDGWIDIYLCSLEGDNRLFLNRGNWRFETAGTEAGVACSGQFSTGAALVDVDGDGDLDLLVTGIGTGTRLFRNDGRGQFAEVAGTELVRAYGATTLTLADVDGDGDLDLYVANYRTTTVRSTGFSLLNVDGERRVMPQDRHRLELTPEGRVLEHGEPDFLYLNDGQGGFRLVSWTQGAFLDEAGMTLGRAPMDWGLTAAFRDLDGDGHPDLYVCNDFHSPDRIWLNDGRGRFRAIPRLALRHTATFSMAVDFADVDRDGRDDILVSDMTSRDHGRRRMQVAGMDPYTILPGVYDDRPLLDRTVLQWNRGDGTYAEVACYAGLENSEWNWSVRFLDVDLDGFEDLLATTGHMFDTQDLDAQARIQAAGPYPRERIQERLLGLPPLDQANLAFRNQGDLTFIECGSAWGFDRVGVSHGIALADLDGDGDLDLVVNDLNAPAGLYQNEATAPRIAVRLEGRPPNRAGIGARVTLRGGPVVQSQEMMAGGRYLSSDDTQLTFAAGPAPRAHTLEVTWPDGTVSRVGEAQANRLYVLRQPPAAGERQTGNEEGREGFQASTAAAPWFEDVSRLLDHRHVEEPFDDFARQPLLPRRLSQLGPGVSWFDVDRDGRVDLIVGAGKGGRLAVYRNRGDGSFERWSGAPWDLPVTRDQTTVLGWRRPDGAVELLAGSANFEDGLPAGAAVRGYTVGQGRITDVLPAGNSSVGPLAMADYDGDGSLDLFVGGRSVPGRYPEPAQSQLWRWRSGGWVLDEKNTAVVSRAGLVSGAVWADLDGDGWVDLVLACEWGPVRVFWNRRGELVEATDTLGLGDYPGWWNGVAVGDFDGDGRFDLLATNWGLNTVHRADPHRPARVYYGDLDESGVVSLIETVVVEPGLELPERDLEALARAIPLMLGRFPTHAAYSRATVADVIGPDLASTPRLEVTTLASTLFLNRTNRFIAVPLPREAQFATGFAVCVADLDGDGHEDVFLSQNFFATHDKTPRCDAGLGLWLRGNGQGGFNAVPVAESGLRVFGEQRGAALADYDGDGRVDLAVTQNGNATRLYRNAGARPGLRVRLSGGAGNREGVGAVLRLGDGIRWGPARAVTAGSGYWSQDGGVQVLAGFNPPCQLEVRWPGGTRTVSRIPVGAREVTVNRDGSVLVDARPEL